MGIEVCNVKDVSTPERLLGAWRIFSFGRRQAYPGYMTVFSYTTIQAPSEGIYKERRSKFHAFAFPVSTEEEVRNYLKLLKKKYHDANHHGYAYILGPAQERHRVFDDGEPNHSTGDPILGQIRSHKLTDVLVVVVRYFGGTQLGIGGLIAAYRTAAGAALSGAVVIEKEVKVTLKVNFEFSATPEIMKMVKEFGIKILDQEFGEKGHMRLEVSLRCEVDLLKRIDLLRARGLGIGKD